MPPGLVPSPKENEGQLSFHTPGSQRSPAVLPSQHPGLGLGPCSSSFQMSLDQLGNKGEIFFGLHLYQLFKMTYAEEIQRLPVLCNF